MTAVTVIALALQLVLLGLALGWRAWHQHRRTGDWGLRRPATPAARAASLLMVGGFVATGAAPVIELAGRGPDLLVDIRSLRVAGLVVIAAAITGTIHAQLALGASWRVGVDPDETLRLVTSGPFAIVRNPIFTWIIVSAVGVAMAVPNIAAVIGTASVAVGVHIQVRTVEEPYLRRLHRSAYASYAESVGRFLPYIGRLNPMRENPRSQR